MIYELSAGRKCAEENGQTKVIEYLDKVIQ